MSAPHWQTVSPTRLVYPTAAIEVLGVAVLLGLTGVDAMQVEIVLLRGGGWGIICNDLTP